MPPSGPPGGGVQVRVVREVTTDCPTQSPGHAPTDCQSGRLCHLPPLPRLPQGARPLSIDGAPWAPCGRRGSPRTGGCEAETKARPAACPGRAPINRGLLCEPPRALRPRLRPLAGVAALVPWQAPPSGRGPSASSHKLGLAPSGRSGRGGRRTSLPQLTHRCVHRHSAGPDTLLPTRACTHGRHRVRLKPVIK
jgi:hypothetical protein